MVGASAVYFDASKQWHKFRVCASIEFRSDANLLQYASRKGKCATAWTHGLRGGQVSLQSTLISPLVSYQCMAVWYLEAWTGQPYQDDAAVFGFGNRMLRRGELCFSSRHQ